MTPVLVPVPDAVLAYFNAGTSKRKASPVGDAIAEGERHRTLISLAGSMRHRGMSGDEITVALLAVNARRCRPPLPDDEVAELAHDVARRYDPDPVDEEQERLREQARRLLDGEPVEEPPPASKRRKAAPLIVSLVEFLGGNEDDAAWLVDHLAARGALVVVAGLPKVGKSTFVYGLLGALTSDADRFVGLPTGSTNVLLMTEEPPATVEEKVDRFGIDDKRVFVISRRTMGAGRTWPKTIAEVVAFCRAHPDVGVVVVDTWDKFVGLSSSRSEADTGTIIEAVEPLWELLGLGVCVILTTHQRKAEGDYGLRVRGGTALTGSADVIVEIERPTRSAGLSGSARVVKIVSRFAGAPDELAVELDDDTGWRSLGNVKAAARRSKRDEILVLLDEEPRTLEEILSIGGLPASNGRTVRRRLDDLVEHALADRTGEGKRLNPYRWQVSESGRTFRDTPESGLSPNVGNPADRAESFVTDSPPSRGWAGWHETLECEVHGGHHKVEKRAAGYLWLACGCRLVEGTA